MHALSKKGTPYCFACQSPHRWTPKGYGLAPSQAPNLYRKWGGGVGGGWTHRNLIEQNALARLLSVLSCTKNKFIWEICQYYLTPSSAGCTYFRGVLPWNTACTLGESSWDVGTKLVSYLWGMAARVTEPCMQCLSNPHPMQTGALNCAVRDSLSEKVPQKLAAQDNGSVNKKRRRKNLKWVPSRWNCHNRARARARERERERERAQYYLKVIKRIILFGRKKTFL
jgi:hypothetical protein